MLNLAARNVAARFPAVGQTNQDPRAWRPQYPPAQLVLYEGVAPRFSLLWEDAQRSWRHLMDLFSVNLARRPDLDGCPG